MLEIDRIKLLAKEKHRSLSYICENIGLKSRSFFSDVEANKVQLTEERLQQIADILGTTTDYLHGKTDKKEKAAPFSGSDLPNDIKEIMSYLVKLNVEEKQELISFIRYLIQKREEPKE